jgi:vacuolar-type H+-ATPase subunit H
VREVARQHAEAEATQAGERADHRLAEAEHSARALREQTAQQVLGRQRTADEELRRARAESAAIVTEARHEADELRAQARRIVEEARAEVALLARQRESITEELGQLSGVIQALAVPTPTHPPTTQEPEQ